MHDGAFIRALEQPLKTPLDTGGSSLPTYEGLSVIGGLDYWTGPLDWTTGLSFFSLFCQNYARLRPLEPR